MQGMYGMVEIEDLKGTVHVAIQTPFYWQITPGNLDKLHWTDDSQLLSVSLKNGKYLKCKLTIIMF